MSSLNSNSKLYEGLTQRCLTKTRKYWMITNIRENIKTRFDTRQQYQHFGKHVYQKHAIVLFLNIV